MTRVCPRCFTKFEPGASLCPDCQVSLVDKPEEPSPTGTPGREDEFVLVGSAPNEVVAKIWIQILEESGIRSVMQNVRPMSGLLGDFSLDLQCDIYVLESQAERAAEIIGSLLEEEGNLPGDESEPFDPDQTN